MTTTHRSPASGLTSFAIYEDQEDRGLLSPSEMFEGDMSFNSELSVTRADEATSTIDSDEGLTGAPQPYTSTYTSRKSSLPPRHSSGATQYSVVSALPSESSIAPESVVPASDAANARFTPRKERPRFRNPESVRAMQLASPPLLPALETSRERLKGSYKLMTPSRSGRSETPVSKKSGSRRGSLRDQHSPKPTPAPQQAPLVLLHVTILPPQMPYSHDFMGRIMPEWLVENYKLLGEKLQDIILMRRGLLIPHPRDEYDLLEERILESLELKPPRLLKCGHFVAPEDDSDREFEDDEAGVSYDNTGRGSRMSGGTFTDENEWKENMLDGTDSTMCVDCNCELKQFGKGVGAGTRRWDIKIYAANGLMRANAWTACWNDMERCDVEISPWIPDKLRKTLEKRIIEEQEAEKRKRMYAVELQRQIEESTSKQKMIENEANERKRLEEVELQKSFEAAAAALKKSIEDKAAEKKKFEEAVQEKIEEAKKSVRLDLEAKALAEASSVAERFSVLEQALQKQKKRLSLQAAAATAPMNTKTRVADIPLTTLLKNYFLVLLRDQRNIIILVLGALVVALTMNMETDMKLQIGGRPGDSNLLNSVHTIAITTTATATATTTATAFSTLTVTEIETATSMPRAALATPSSAEPIYQAQESTIVISVASAELPIDAETAQVIKTGLEDETPAHSPVNEPSLPLNNLSIKQVEFPTTHNMIEKLSTSDFCPPTNIFHTPISYSMNVAT
ncbi:hypothetical protein GQ44DRAFT_715355 [Phaeosphaeriaceae sp. PMI808]|nr:hypothetical protein GQ44DRAFT_715355 [Phaeosphaeriaceae sp. PMI808]